MARPAHATLARLLGRAGFLAGCILAVRHGLEFVLAGLAVWLGFNWSDDGEE